MLTPGEIDDFTQRLQQAASQRLREKIPVPAGKNFAGLSDRDRALVAAIAASSDPLESRNTAAEAKLSQERA